MRGVHFPKLGRDLCRRDEVHPDAAVSFKFSVRTRPLSTACFMAVRGMH
jgi:hypothetical protein